VTPVDPLTFSRSYRQNKRSAYQIMGLGWTHNHAAWLTKISGSPNILIVTCPTAANCV